MESFYKPIILKEDSSLDNKLAMLKHFPVTNKKEIDMIEKGIAGEKQVLYHLQKSNIGMYILRDINLKIDGLKAQIDFVVITSHHCYFIESKNYTADIIYIDENRNFEISTKYKNRFRRRGIKSPLSQANDQLSVFQRLFLKNKENTNSIFNEIKFEDYFKTMVIFTNPESRIENKKAPFDMKYRVLKVDNLINQIEYDEKHYNGIKLSQDKMLEIANYFLNNNIQINYNSFENKQKSKISHNNYKKDNTFAISVISIIVIMLIGSVAYRGTFNELYNNDSNSSQNNNTNTSRDDTDKYELRIMTDNNIAAINNLKEKYNNSKKYGFDLYDYNQCIYLNEVLKGNLSCNGRPMQVNFSGDNSLSIYHNNYCYYLKYDTINNTVINSSYKYVGYDIQCPGIDIGLIHYDSTNQFFNKIGGYNKILEMARFAHNNNSGFEKYYDFSKVSERGGNSDLASTYRSVVDKYFDTISNKGFANGTNTLEDFNKMVEYYYYIMK